MEKERRFACSDRTEADKAKGLGVVLTLNNMKGNQAKCKECRAEIYVHLKCTNVGSYNGQLCKTHRQLQKGAAIIK